MIVPPAFRLVEMLPWNDVPSSPFDQQLELPARSTCTPRARLAAAVTSDSCATAGTGGGAACAIVGVGLAGTTASVAETRGCAAATGRTMNRVPRIGRKTRRVDAGRTSWS